MSPFRRTLPTLTLVVALSALAGSWWTASRPALRAPPTAAVDLLPLWLGAGLVLEGADPTDSKAAEARFTAEGLPMRPGGFFSYYPPTASLLALPLRALSFRNAVELWRVVCSLSTPLGVMLAALAGFAALDSGLRLRWRQALTTAALIGALAVLARPARIVLPTGQPGPIVVLFTGAALLFLALDKPRSAAVLATLGAAVKLVPGVMLPIFLVRRQWGAAVASAGVVVGLGAGLFAFGVAVHLVEWVRELVGFVGRGPLPSWSAEPPWLLALWRWRVVLVTVGFVVALAVAWRRGVVTATALDLAALAVASVGVVLAGSHHYHEALILLPALAHALAWPAQMPRSRVAWLGAVALCLVCALGWPAFAPRGRPDSLHWLAIGAALWGVCCVRAVGMAAPRPRPAAAGGGVP
ncbi:hypothetical protein LBMAG42_16500 [Deltaproteobacteria bacterium]|nr:hypothetical protein LBMAG42_16500 [Deltaproteobacteria bacterium]